VLLIEKLMLAYVIAQRFHKKDLLMNIYVGNLSYDTTEDGLKVMFEEFGEVESCRVITDRNTGRSKGFGFLEMPNNSEADQAIKALNGKHVEGRNIKVNQANPSGGRRPKKSFHQRRY
jgi:RNA recognition motif-containing protein